MTHHADGIEVGKANDLIHANLGVPTSPTYIYAITPAQIDADALVASATQSGAPFTATLTTGSGVTTTTINGETLRALDYPRNIIVTGGGASTAGVSITVDGYEKRILRDGTFVRGRAMTETFTGPTGTATAATAKAFGYVKTITGSGNTVSAISVGTGDVYGLPIRVNNFGWIAAATWSGLTVTGSAFTAADTATATAATGDVRGTIAAPSASDGTKKLVVHIGVEDPDTNEGLWGKAQA